MLQLPTQASIGVSLTPVPNGRDAPGDTISGPNLVVAGFPPRASVLSTTMRHGAGPPMAQLRLSCASAIPNRYGPSTLTPLSVPGC